MTRSSAPTRQGRGSRRGVELHDARGDLRRRHEGRGRHVEEDPRPRVRQPHEHAEAAVVARSRRVGDDALGDLALEHQRQRSPPGRPRLGGEPAGQQRGADVVGQVGDDPGRRAAGERRAGRSPARRRRRPRAGRDNARRSRRAPAGSARRARSRRPRAAPAASSARVRPPGPGPTSMTVASVERPGGARDAAGQIEVEQEVLAERLLRA